MLQRNTPANFRSSSSVAAGPPQHIGFAKRLGQTGSAWLRDNCMQLAAALACYAVLSLAPLVVILFRLVRLVLQNQQAQQLLTLHLQNLVGAGASTSLIRAILESSKKNSGTLATVVSIAVLFFGASGVFSELQDSMNRIWGVRPKPGKAVWAWIRARFFSMTMVLGLGFLLLVSFFISTLLSAFARDLLGNSPAVGIALDVLLSLAVITLMMALIFKWLPDVKIRWEDVWLGAFTTAALFIAGKWGLTLYFQYGAPTSAYGVFGSFAAVVIWVYYAAQILYFGAEFTRIHAQNRGHPVEPNQHAEPLPPPPP